MRTSSLSWRCLLLLVALCVSVSIQAAEQVELLPLLGATGAGCRFKIRNGCVLDVKDRARKGSRHEAVVPVGRPRIGGAGDQHDEAGQILVYRAQSVGGPGSDGRIPLTNGTGVHL